LLVNIINISICKLSHQVTDLTDSCPLRIEAKILVQRAIKPT
jgi:hypothetical protein